jgi:hypothetical protein
MKTKTSSKILNVLRPLAGMLIIISIIGTSKETSAQALCANASTSVFGLTDLAAIQPIDVNTGIVSDTINPRFTTGYAPSYANALGYSSLNGKFYFFKRNVYVSTPQFVCYDPAFNSYTYLAPCPSTIIVNLGCMSRDGTGYYCLDAFANLYYYSVALNTWTLISNKLKDGTTSLQVVLAKDSTIYGDMAIDGSDNMWILVSGKKNYGLYRLAGPLPITNQLLNLNLIREIPPTRPSIDGSSFGGMALSSNGNIYVSTNSPDNRIYIIESNKVAKYLSTMSASGVGNDLTSCNYPMVVLPVKSTVQSDIPAVKNEYKVWPTITKNTINVEVAKNNLTKQTLLIFDQWGKLVKQLNLVNKVSTVDISQLHPGTFYINVKSETGDLYAQKIVKM